MTLFDFSRRERDIIKLLSLPAWGGTMIKRLGRSPPKIENLDGSGQDQDELQRSGTTLICREESNGGRLEGAYKRI